MWMLHGRSAAVNWDGRTHNESVVRGRCGPNCWAAHFITMIGYAIARGAENWAKELARPIDWRDERTPEELATLINKRDQRRSINGRASAARASRRRAATGRLR